MIAPLVSTTGRLGGQTPRRDGVANKPTVLVILTIVTRISMTGRQFGQLLSRGGAAKIMVLPAQEQLRQNRMIVMLATSTGNQVGQ